MSQSCNTAIILSGGKGTRLGGVEKAFLTLRNQTFLDYKLTQLTPFFSEIIVVTNQPTLYKQYNITIVKDIENFKGPLMGLYSGLINSHSDFCFVTASDMPFISKKLLEFFLTKDLESDILLPVINNKFQVCCGIYSQSIVETIENLIESGKSSLKSLVDHVKTIDLIEEQTLRTYDPHLISFMNVNTQEDLQFIQEYMSSC